MFSNHIRCLQVLCLQSTVFTERHGSLVSVYFTVYRCTCLEVLKAGNPDRKSLRELRSAVLGSHRQPNAIIHITHSTSSGDYDIPEEKLCTRRIKTIVFALLSRYPVDPEEYFHIT